MRYSRSRGSCWFGRCAVHQSTRSRSLLSSLTFIAWLLACTTAAHCDESTVNSPQLSIEATTLHHKVLCGYQGWFRCPGDLAGDRWHHWSRNASRIGPDTLTFEMWPDMSEYDADESFPATGFTHSDGRTAQLFSSAHPKTVQRHFQWMQKYGIDGVFLQRFLVETGIPSLDLVLDHVRKSAAETGRVYAICYDLSGARSNQLYEKLSRDWQRLVDDKKIDKDPTYLHHAGKPVVFVWGF